MGYLFDNIPPGRNYAFCPDLYPYRILVDAALRSDRELAAFVKDEIPDVEEWQFSGRRQYPIISVTGIRQPRRQVHPASYANDSRRMRPFIQKVWFAFHTADQRAQVMARFNQELVKYRIVNEPGTP